MTKLMIYGATGYTGRMVAQHAKAAGIPLVLAGRSEAPLAKLASELATEYRVFALDEDVLINRSVADVADIETFVHVTGDGFPQGDLSVLPDGPSEQERLANRYQALVEVTDADGKVTRSLLDTVNGYSFTAIAVAEAGRRVLAGEVRPGFQTPAGLFGNGFAETIADTTIIDI